LLRESATALVSRLVPPPTPEEYDAGLVRALAEMNRVGIVSFVEASARAPVVEAYRAVARQGKLTARAHLSLYLDPDDDESQIDRFIRIRQQTSEPGVTVNMVKIFVDGVIEAATASLIEPYLPLAGEPAPTYPRGLPNFAEDRLIALVTRLDRERFQVHMHAIGDRAIRQGLDAIEAAGRENGPRDRRPHIAHLQLFHPDDIPRFRELGVVANIQPLWAYADSYIRTLTEPRLGRERSQWLYPFAATGRCRRSTRSMPFRWRSRGGRSRRRPTPPRGCRTSDSTCRRRSPRTPTAARSSASKTRTAARSRSASSPT
jgi:predicted amidohydrolase YtcJ